MELCAKAKPNDPTFVFSVAQVFQRQKAFGLAARLLSEVASLAEGRKALLPLYRKQLEGAWPGLGSALIVDEKGQLAITLRNQIADLHPLKGMQLNVLHISDCSMITDLSPLRGMPLTTLSLAHGTELRELSPLRGMQLTSQTILRSAVADLTPLEDMPLGSLVLNRCHVLNLGPLKRLTLTSLDLTGCPVTDLTPIQGMPLSSLTLTSCTTLHDLSPLRGMPLTRIDLHGCMADDLSPLEGMKLEQITMNFPRSIKKGIEVLRPMKTLRRIHLGGGDGLTFSPEQFWKKYDAKELPR